MRCCWSGWPGWTEAAGGARWGYLAADGFKESGADKFDIVCPPLSILAEPLVAANYAKQVPKVNLFGVDEVFGGWARAQKTHFADGGVLDQI